MTPAEFKKKRRRYQGKESSAYQEHFSDLCRLLGQPTPAEADPTGSESFCFQKRVMKNAELLFELREETEPVEPSERGFADVWKKGCFAWEYKGKKKNLEDAYKQLLRYRESLLNPPLLVVCDFDRYIVRTNFNGTVQEVHEFTNDLVDRPQHLKILRSVFSGSRAQETRCRRRRRLWLERLRGDSGNTGPGEVYDFEEGAWRILDTDEKGYTASLEKFRRDFDERILERLLALNLERAAEEEKAAKVKKPKTSRAKRADEML